MRLANPYDAACRKPAKPSLTNLRSLAMRGTSRSVFSKTASSPTKMGEMLALGLPIVTNAGVGDVEAMVMDMDCGVAIRSFEEESYVRALDRLRAMTSSNEERRRRALPWFDLEVGVDRYDQVYRNTAT